MPQYGVSSNRHTVRLHKRHHPQVTRTQKVPDPLSSDFGLIITWKSESAPWEFYASKKTGVIPLRTVSPKGIQLTNKIEIIIAAKNRHQAPMGDRHDIKSQFSFVLHGRNIPGNDWAGNLAQIKWCILVQTLEFDNMHSKFFNVLFFFSLLPSTRICVHGHERKFYLNSGEKENIYISFTLKSENL